MRHLRHVWSRRGVRLGKSDDYPYMEKSDQFNDLWCSLVIYSLKLEVSSRQVNRCVNNNLLLISEAPSLFYQSVKSEKDYDNPCNRNGRWTTNFFCY